MNTLLQWALGSAVLILFVVALRLLLKNKLSARWRYALWAAVLVRLLVPHQIPLSLPASLASLTPEFPYQMDYPTVSVYPPGVPDPSGEFVSTFQTYLEGGKEALYTQTRADGTSVTTAIPVLTRYQVLERWWGVSALLAGAVLLAVNGTFYLRLRKRRRPLEVPDCPLPVYAAEGLPSPCLFGLFRPAVYLTPEVAALPDGQRRHILAHELTHYAHGDHIWSVLRCAALALHWYDPLVWLAAVLSKGDGELACDEGAVERLGEAERVPYGRTLVGLSVRPTRPADLLECSTAMTGGKKALRDRVAALVRRPETRKTALFAAAALLALAAVFVFAGQEQDKTPELFLSQLDQADTIQYCPNLISGTIYPDPIGDEDLLAEAKERLSGLTCLEDGEPYPELRDLPLASRIVLVNERAETEYTILWQDNYTYLFPGDLWEEQLKLQAREGETAQLQAVSGTLRSQAGDNLVYALSDLAKRQNDRDRSAWREVILSSALRGGVTEIQFQFTHMDTVYPAITDPDLLEQAAEVLRTAGDPGDGTWEGGGAQVSIRDENGGRLANFPLSNREMIQTLDRLTMEQWERDGEAAVPSDYEQYQARLSSARAIWINMPMLHDSRVLTDPDLLEQAKALLSLDPIPQGGPAEWDGVWSDIISFADTVPDADWTGGPEWYYLAGGDGDFYYVCSGSSQTGGCYLGTLPSENWEQVQAMLRQAPSLDDRQQETRSLPAGAEGAGR